MGPSLTARLATQLTAERTQTEPIHDFATTESDVRPSQTHQQSLLEKVGDVVSKWLGKRVEVELHRS